MTPPDTLSRERRCELLAIAEPAALTDLADRCLADGTRPTLLVGPEVGMTMLDVREPVCGDRFYLGEVLVTRAEAQLDGAASVAVFRTLLDTLARPGTVLQGSRVRGGVPPALVPALALADVDMRVAVVGDAAEVWSEVLRAVTGAAGSSIATASIIVALRPLQPAEVHVMERGDALHPERSCRLVLACRSLHAAFPDAAQPGAVTLRLRGPGVPDERTLRVEGVGAEVFEALAEVNREFPAGVDTHLVAASGAMCGIPRSTSIEVLDGGLS